MEPTLRTAQVLKQEAEDLGFEGKELLDYVKEQQKLNREDRAEWRKIRMAELQTEEKKRADESEDKKRADELQAEREKRADEIRFAQIEAVKDQARIEADKELTLKELELKAQQNQTSASLAVTPPPRNKDAKSPKLPSFIDEKDELDSYLLRFECYAENASWEKDTLAIKLSALLTGRAMDVLPGCHRHANPPVFIGSLPIFNFISRAPVRAQFLPNSVIPVRKLPIVKIA